MFIPNGKKGVGLVGPVVLWLVLAVLSASGQGPAPTPTPLPPGGSAAPALTFTDSMQRFGANIATLLPVLANEVERPLEGWILNLALLLAIFCFLSAVSTQRRGHETEIE